MSLIPPASATLIRNSAATETYGTRNLGGALVGASYVVVKTETKINWEAARKACNATGGGLAVLTSYKAIDAIEGFVANDGETQGR